MSDKREGVNGMAKIIGNLSIAHKLWIAFGLSLACMIGVSLNILSGVNIIQEKTSRMEKRNHAGCYFCVEVKQVS